MLTFFVIATIVLSVVHKHQAAMKAEANSSDGEGSTNKASKVFSAGCTYRAANRSTKWFLVATIPTDVSYRLLYREA